MEINHSFIEAHGAQDSCSRLVFQNAKACSIILCIFNILDTNHRLSSKTNGVVSHSSFHVLLHDAESRAGRRVKRRRWCFGK